MFATDRKSRSKAKKPKEQLQQGKTKYNAVSLKNLRDTKIWRSPCFSHAKVVKLPPEIVPQLREISYWVDKQPNPIEAMDKLVEFIQSGEYEKMLSAKEGR
jgi:hypothetical protein